MNNLKFMLDNFSTEALIGELIRRTTIKKYEFLLNKWNSFYFADIEYGVKIELRGKYE